MSLLPEPLGAAPVLPIVTSDLACRKCSYNLRGLPTNGRCPECGTPVGISQRGTLLQFGEPAWLEALRTGITLILLGIAIAVANFVISFVAQIIGGDRSQLLTTLVGWASGVSMVMGTWMLTTPDPSGLGEQGYGKSRRLVRVAAVISFAGGFLNAIQLLAGNVAPGVAILIGVIAMVSGICSLAGYLAQLYYLEKLANRIPDPDLSGRAHSLLCGIGISYAVIIFLGIVMVAAVAIAGPSAGGAGELSGMLVGCALVVAGIALLVLYIRYIIMLVDLRRRIDEAMRTAKSLWHAPAEPNPPSTTDARAKHNPG